MGYSRALPNQELGKNVPVLGIRRFQAPVCFLDLLGVCLHGAEFDLGVMFGEGLWLGASFLFFFY